MPLDKIASQSGFEPPCGRGLTTDDACKGIKDGSAKGFVGPGGNLVRAVPDRYAMEPAWQRLAFTVFVATKLNRSHLIHGKVSYLLPCLARPEENVQASGPQSVAIRTASATSMVRAASARRRRRR